MEELIEKKKLVRCFNLDTGESMYFVSRTPYEAMKSLLYYLNLSHMQKDVKINMLGGGRTLSLVYNGQTWSCVNK